MALLAETLVEEWLNRRGYFTVRGVREGVSEMDLLAIKPSEATGVEARHVEVQTSFRPIGYISLSAKSHADSTGRRRSLTAQRTPETLRESVSEWVHKKYLSPKKAKLREAMWPGAAWKYVLVHAVVKYPEELQEIEKRGVELVSLQTVLEDLCPPERPPFTASAGGDLADLIDFYGRTRQLPLTNEHEDEDHIEDVRAT